MALAVPYCDIVVTEKHRAHLLRAAGLDTRMATLIIDQPRELSTYLEAA